MNKFNYKKEEGFALLLAIIVSSIALSIGLSMLSLTLKQIELGSTTYGSEVAFQASNAGMECFRYLRNTNPDEFSNQNPSIFSASCLGTTINFNDLRNDSRKQDFQEEFDWTTQDGRNICIEMEIMVLNAVNTAINHTFLDRGFTKNCSLGDICTYAFIRGYNLDCVTKATSIDAVQRELTIEF